MRDGPDGAVLLAIARAALLGEVLPCVPPEQTYTVRMIANAMAIAARELAAEAAAIEHETGERVTSLYRHAGLPQPPPDLPPEALERRLAADIRAGRFDAHESALRSLLEWQVDERLALANPKLRQAKNEAG
jgi:Domain of unknown function (DUF6285)